MYNLERPSHSYKKHHHKECTICGMKFITGVKSQNVCSWACRKEAKRDYARNLMRIRRKRKEKDGVITYPPCEVCGWNLTTDIHHEGQQTFHLCPNHHALITRGLKTIDQLLGERVMKPKEEELTNINQ